MYSAQHWINKLQLKAHPEGGFYKETYRSHESIPANGLPQRFGAPRSFCTSIFFLLRAEDRSLFHKIKSDELWHFHAGSSLSIYVLNDLELRILKLGSDVMQGESLQVVVPANTWFGATVDDADGYTLAGCTVAPGFDFADLQMAERQSLLKQFPMHASIVDMLTK